MLNATRATINGIMGPDLVNQSTEWRGRGQGVGNVFGKEGQATSTFKKYKK